MRQLYETQEVLTPDAAGILQNELWTELDSAPPPPDPNVIIYPQGWEDRRH